MCRMARIFFLQGTNNSVILKSFNAKKLFSAKVSLRSEHANMFLDHQEQAREYEVRKMSSRKNSGILFFEG